MITPDLLRQAIKRAHETCAAEGCIHEPAKDALGDELKRQVYSFGMLAMATACDPVMSTFDMGLHIGYRLAQLEAEADAQPTDSTKIN